MNGDSLLLDWPDLGPLWLSVKLAAITTLILLVVGAAIAWWLANTRSKAKPVIQSLVALPIVLPPTVMGFYLLILLGPYGAIGGWWVELTGSALTFSFTGLVIASCFYSLPFAVQPLQGAFESMGRKEIEAAQTLGASPMDAFFSIVVPLSAPGFLTALVLSFAHTLGEFGVVIMIGGNIPGETQVLSIAIYDHVEGLEYTHAHWLTAALLLLSFLMLISVYALNRRFNIVRP